MRLAALLVAGPSHWNKLRCLSKSLPDSHFAVNPDLKNCFIDSAPDLQHPVSPVADHFQKSSQGLERPYEKHTLVRGESSLQASESACCIFPLFPVVVPEIDNAMIQRQLVYA